MARCALTCAASSETPAPATNADPALDAETFEASTRYDALNRPIQSVAPHSSRPGPHCNVIQPAFNEANLLARVDVWLERDTEPAALLDPNTEAPAPVGVSGVDYNAKGQRLRIDYKNGASTSYQYDPLTFRLTQLVTRRDPTTFPGDDPQPPVTGWPGRLVQNLQYTYDPAGNITHIQDDAQQTIFFRNQRVEPSNDYVYDATYRLIQAGGRQLLARDRVGTPQCVESRRGDFTDDPDRQPWAGKGFARNDFLGQPQLAPNRAHLVFEQ